MNSKISIISILIICLSSTAFNVKDKDKSKLTIQQACPIGSTVGEYCGATLNSSVCLSQSNGKVKLIYFWGDWSPKSVEGLRALNDIYARYSSFGLEIFSINLASSEYQNQFDNLMNWKNRANDKVDISNPDNREVYKTFGKMGASFALLLDKDNKVIYLSKQNSAVNPATITDFEELENSIANNLHVEMQDIKLRVDTIDIPESITHLSGYKTYRIYAVMKKLNYLVSAVIGNDEYPLILKTTGQFYQNKYGSDILEKINPKLEMLDNSLAYDSWLTIGNFNYNASQFKYVNFVEDKQQSWIEPFGNGNSIELNSKIGGGWLCAPNNQVMLSKPSTEVLLAQLTTNGDISGTINLVVNAYDPSLQIPDLKFESRQINNLKFGSKIGQ